MGLAPRCPAAVPAPPAGCKADKPLARCYPPGVSAESAVIKALRREAPRRILHCLMVAGPRAGLEFSHISERVGKAPSTVSVCLSQLV